MSEYLSYQLPAPKMWALRLSPFLIFGLLAVIEIALGLPWTQYWPISNIVLLVPCTMASLYLMRTVEDFACTGSGLEIVAMWGRRYHIPWSEIVSLRRKPLGFYAMDIRRVPYSVNLLMPDEIRTRLVSILREASNAGIVGAE